jgi:hypothetical protein
MPSPYHFRANRRPKPVKIFEKVTIISIDSPKGKARQIVSETDNGHLYSWSKTGLAYYLQPGFRGHVAGMIWQDRSFYQDYRLTRAQFLHIGTKGPGWFQDPEALKLLALARQNPKDPLPRMVLADWIADTQGDPGQALAECIKESSRTNTWAFPERKFRQDLEPLTGACKGWPIGLFQSSNDDAATKAWLNNRDMLGFRIPRNPWDNL